MSPVYGTVAPELAEPEDSAFFSAAFFSSAAFFGDQPSSRAVRALPAAALASAAALAAASPSA